MSDLVAWLVLGLVVAGIVRGVLRARRPEVPAAAPASSLVLRVGPPPPGAHRWRVPTCKCGGTKWRAERVLRTGSLVARCLGCSVVQVWERSAPESQR